MIIKAQRARIFTVAIFAMSIRMKLKAFITFAVLFVVIANNDGLFVTPRVVKKVVATFLECVSIVPSSCPAEICICRRLDLHHLLFGILNHLEHKTLFQVFFVTSFEPKIVIFLASGTLATHAPHAFPFILFLPTVS
jgi:hypothetical protein